MHDPTTPTSPTEPTHHTAPPHQPGGADPDPAITYATSPFSPPPHHPHHPGRRHAAVIACDVLLGPDTRGLVYAAEDHAVIDLGGCRLIGHRDDIAHVHHVLGAALAALDQPTT